MGIKENKLFAEVFSDVAKLDEALNKFVVKLSGYNPDALSETKKILWKETDHWETLLHERAAISGELVLSDFTRKALSAFKK